MDEITLNSSIRDRFKAQDRKPEWAVPFPEVAFWISTARAGGRKTAAVRSRLGLQPLQNQTGLQTALIVLFYLF